MYCIQMGMIICAPLVFCVLVEAVMQKWFPSPGRCPDKKKKSSLFIAHRM